MSIKPRCHVIKLSGILNRGQIFQIVYNCVDVIKNFSRPNVKAKLLKLARKFAPIFCPLKDASVNAIIIVTQLTLA